MPKPKKARDGKITKRRRSPSPEKSRGAGNPGKDAEFLGWQKPRLGEIFPLYNIVKEEHPSHLSTVTDKTLHTMHLRVPSTPSPYPDKGSSPWHSLGVELDDPATASEAIQAAGLDYTVVKKPLKEVLNLVNPAEGADSWATVRTDTGDVLGIVEDSYEPIQNRIAFRFFDRLVGANEARYETAGVLGYGERIWILARLPGFINVRGNDVVSKYLLLTNSHDGITRVRVKLTPIRVVCDNTLTAALQGSGEVHIHHSSHAAKDIEQALVLLGWSNSLYEELNGVFNRMARTKISDEQLGEYVRALVPDNEEGMDTARTREIRDEVLALYESGLGSYLSRGTLWGAYNSVTEYTDHLMAEVNPTKRLESIWFGPGEQLKLKAFHLAEQMIAL